MITTDDWMTIENRVLETHANESDLKEFVEQKMKGADFKANPLPLSTTQDHGGGIFLPLVEQRRDSGRSSCRKFINP
jgi:hypothetical protein